MLFMLSKAGFGAVSLHLNNLWSQPHVATTGTAHSIIASFFSCLLISCHSMCADVLSSC